MKIRTDWEALRDTLEPEMALLFSGSGQDLIRSMSNALVSCIRSGRQFHLPGDTPNYQIVRGHIDGLIAGARAAITSARAG